ncbi:MAG: alpha/beta hydrolase [Phenylobacterium sp.]|uniref:poly(ethylene terephthalate) hydrolase family protein n=1 Tax=Phenylobacterium sp. TaxID=1871053 RepID=UPI003BB4D90D
MKIIPLALALAAMATLAQAQTPPPAMTAPNILAVPADAPPQKAPPLGPYAVTVETDASLPTHTLYRPTDLAAVQGRLPIVAWGNGGCANSSSRFTPFLTKIASHGFLVVAIGPKDGPPLELRPAGQSVPIAAPKTSASQLIDAINWAERQNIQAGPYKGRVDTQAVAVMGQSCGGLQAIEASGDPRVKTTVVWNSGVIVDQAGLPKLSNATKDSLKAYHAPVAYFIGGPVDVAWPNANDDFAKITTVPVFMGNLNVGHGGTYRHVNGGWFGEVGQAWLAWRLKGDKAAATLFEGPKCGLCIAPEWKIQKKNMD